MAVPAQRACAARHPEPKISFEYIAAVRGPHPDSVTAVAFRPLVSAGWVIAGVITEYSGAVTVAVRPAP